LPLLQIALARMLRQRLELELVVAPLTLGELTFGLTATPGLVDGAVVLPAELVLQRT
jgi:hypothetical protein